MENDHFHAFADYCAVNGIAEEEGKRGELHMHVPKTRYASGYWVYHTPLQVRSFRPVTLRTVFGLTEGGIAAVKQRADHVEQANKLWLAT